MGDFERTFGAGANIDSIINGINRNYFREQRQTRNEKSTSSKNTFPSFQAAITWAKENPGRAITRSPDGIGYIEK